MITRCIIALLTLAFAVLSVAAAAQPPDVAALRLKEFLDSVPGVGPGFAVVAVTSDDVLLVDTRGVRRAARPEALTADTPMYIASQTKAYVGLLAAILDERGVLDLEDTLADHWPEPTLPDDVDPADYSLRELLSHQLPIRNYYVTGMEAYVTRLDSADYPRLLQQRSTPREPGFAYDNLGYNIYAAVLETATGKSWQDWLHDEVFAPLGMQHSSARVSDFRADAVAWSHQWFGEKNGWYEVGPKTDAQMQSAGGIYTSPRDMGRWLQLQLRGEGPESSGITASMVTTAQALTADTRPDGHESQGLDCHGYTLGWNLCDYAGRDLWIHGGGYTGARTDMAFSTELGVGIATFSNSDNMTGWLTRNTLMQFLEFVVDDPHAEHKARQRAARYPELSAELLQNRLQRIVSEGDGEQWRGWSWQPSKVMLHSYVGRYADPVGLADIVIRLEDGQLLAKRDSWEARLKPAVPDLFGARTTRLAPFAPLRFERDNDGSIIALTLETDRSYSSGHFQRITKKR